MLDDAKIKELEKLLPDDVRKQLENKSKIVHEYCIKVMNDTVDFCKNHNDLVYTDSPVTIGALAHNLIKMLGEYVAISKFDKKNLAAMAIDRQLSDLRKTLNESAQKNNRNLV